MVCGATLYIVDDAGCHCEPAPFIVTDVHDFSRLGDLTGLGFAGLSFADNEARWAIAALLTLAFALLARRMHGVTNSGALVGAVSCFVLYLGGGPGAFAALVSVFALAWITTRLGYQRKQKLGTAERREGRKGSQVLANLGVATACAALSLLGPSPDILPAGDGGSAFRGRRRHGFERNWPGLRRERPPDYHLELGSAGNRWRGEPDSEPWPGSSPPES